MTRAHFTLKAVACALLAGIASAPSLAADTHPFPRPAELEPDVRFWTRIYSEVSTSGGLIHDSRHLAVVYEVVRFPKGASSRTRERNITSVKNRYRAILRSLARGKRSGLTADERRVLALWPDGVSNSTLRAAANRLRFQLGQADKFRAGIIRSGAWEPYIRETLREMNLPHQLSALPHVESSYTPHAYSRVGAAGLWQFTRSTGRRFMRVDHVVDERLDPYRATVAAGRLLEQNRQTTGSWPLAITAYNHGAAGMRRAVRQLGTRDIAVVARKYKSRSFGFASRNFYVEFLAALDVESNAERYFGKLQLNQPREYEVVEVPYYTSASTLQRALGVDGTTLRDHNPALRSPVWGGAKYVPRGFQLRIPREALARPVSLALQSIPASERHAKQIRDTIHTVRRGETLSQIASRYGIRMSEIVALNGLRSRNRIRVGQSLRLPDPRGGVRRASTPAPVATPIAPPTDGRYTVRRGDTLTRIASRFGLDERELMNINRLRNRNRIYVGQTLQLAALPKTGGATSDVHPQSPVAMTAPSRSPEPAKPEAAAEAEANEELEVAEIAQPPASVEAQEISPGVAAVSEEVEGGAPPLGPTQMVADPSDYSVAADGTIEIQAAETLGHIADWLNIRASQLRQMNRLRFGQALPIGRRLRIDTSHISSNEFERRRIEFHRSLQGEFFDRFEIAGTETHVMRRGDSLWTLSQRKFGVPIWLLRQYNPDLDFESLHAGARITIPMVRPHGGKEGASAQAPGAASEARAPSAAQPSAG